MAHNTQHEEDLQLFIDDIKTNLDDALDSHGGYVGLKLDVASLEVMSNLAIAKAINNLSRSIRDSFGSSIEGPAFLEKIAMILDNK